MPTRTGACSRSLHSRGVYRAIFSFPSWFAIVLVQVSRALYPVLSRTRSANAIMTFVGVQQVPSRAPAYPFISECANSSSMGVANAASSSAASRQAAIPFLPTHWPYSSCHLIDILNDTSNIAHPPGRQFARRVARRGEYQSDILTSRDIKTDRWADRPARPKRCPTATLT